MTVQSSGDGRVVSDTQVNRCVVLSQTGLLRLTRFLSRAVLHWAH